MSSSRVDPGEIRISAPLPARAAVPHHRICVFLLLVLVVTGARVGTTARGQSSPGPRTTTILVSIDGFRWDFLGRGLTPNLERLSEQGTAAISFESVFPSKTYPAHYSIVTGLFPENHGVISNDFWDPERREFFDANDRRSKDPGWWRGEAFWETARRHGIVTASYFWPGSDVNDPLRRPDHWELYDRKRPYEERLAGVMRWLKMPEKRRPRFVTMYLEGVDGEAHRHGPDAPETTEAIKDADRVIGRLLDGLAEMGGLARFDVIVLSDHGMSAVSLDRIIDAGAALGGDKARVTGFGAMMMIWPDGEDTAPALAGRLREHLEHCRVYEREEVPRRFHFSKSGRIAPIVVVADLGWTLLDLRETSREVLAGILVKGNHGYDPSHLEMHGIFVAAGPSFRAGYRTGTVMAVDVYPLLCRMFEIPPRVPIDGRIERIEHLLADR